MISKILFVMNAFIYFDQKKYIRNTLRFFSRVDDTARLIEHKIKRETANSGRN